MPIYEYDCYDCETQVELFFRTFSDVETKQPVCPRCQGSNLERRISKVRVVNAAGRESADQTTAPSSSQSRVDDDDPKALAQTMRQANKQDMGRDFNEVAARLERGEKADSIEKSLRKRVGEKMEPH